MAIVEVKVPQLSESVAEATMLQWKKKAGDAVAVDEILIEIETDKVVLEVPAPSAGVLTELVVADGGTVGSDQVIARIDTTPHGPLATIGPNAWNDGGLVLCENGSGKVSGISTAVWSFAVSGYPLLPRWLAGREGISVDDAFIKEFRDITGRINELIHCFDEADLVLQQALTHSLTRDDLGLPPDRDEAVHDQP